MKDGLHAKVSEFIATIPAGAWRWPHFTPLELACKCKGQCCEGEYYHDPDFLDGLEAIRAALASHYGEERPIRINSGHRCKDWNKRVGGAVNSRHLDIAADIGLAGHDRFAVRTAAEAAGFKGIGLATNFLHVDRRQRAAVWNYGLESQRAWKISG